MFVKFLVTCCYLLCIAWLGSSNLKGQGFAHKATLGHGSQGKSARECRNGKGSSVQCFHPAPPLHPTTRPPSLCYFSLSVILSFAISGEKLVGTVACKDWYQLHQSKTRSPAQGIRSNIHRNVTKNKSTQTLASALASLGTKSIYIGSYEVSKTFWIATPWLPAVGLKLWNKA